MSCCEDQHPHRLALSVERQHLWTTMIRGSGELAQLHVLDGGRRSHDIL